MDPGASLITGPSSSSKQLHRSLGQSPWMGNWEASEWILCAVFSYTVECVNIGVLLDVTFTINGVPHTLQPTAYTLLVRTVSLFCKSQGHPHMPATSPFQTVACTQGAFTPCLPPILSSSESIRSGRGGTADGGNTAGLVLTSCSAMKQQQTLDKPFHEVF